MATESFSGKAGSLAFLKSLGLKVPEWQVISHDELVGWGDPARWDELQLAVNTFDLGLASVLANFLDSVTVPPEILGRFEGNWLAVRSSASVEDGRDNSFAGIFETKLFVREDLPQAIKHVWGSLYSPKALAYCKERGVPLRDLSMDVVVQDMIIGEKSGVLFQADPTGKIDRLVITAGHGLGQGVVDEITDTDQFVYVGGKQQERVINPKLKCLTFNPVTRTLETSPVPDRKMLDPVLTDDELEELLSLSRHLDLNSKTFLDVEFTIKDGLVFLLQARPITTLRAKKDIIIYDNSNIAENYPGQTLPLTYASLQRAYAANFRNLIAYLGFPESERRELDNRLNQLVGYWGGQVYYNLNNWYGVYTLLPIGQDQATASFNDMVGISARAFLPEPSRSPLQKLRILAGILPRFLSYFALTRYHHRAYKEHFAELYAEFKLKVSDAEGVFEILSLIEEIDRKYLGIIKIPLFNDFFSSILNKSCRHVIRELVGEKGPGLLNDLLSHREDLESSKAIYSLLELAGMVRESAELREFLSAQLENPELMVEISRNPEFEDFDLKLRYHLDRFGDRAQWEMKLETPTARENPKPLFKLLLDYAHHDVSVERHKDRERQKAERAEAELRDLARGKGPRSTLFWFLFKKNTQAVGFREDSRFDRVRMKGIMRELLQKLGTALVGKDRLEQKEDIFYLSYEELQALNYEAYGNGYLKELIQLRKKYLAQTHERPLTDRIVVNDVTNVNQHEVKRRGQTSGLSGIPCSGGKVTSQVVVVRDLNTAPSLSGKILVAERTDPSWGYFFVGVKGIIVEKGSMLSHAAIISRELGIPCIINVAGATYTLKDGATVTMDGDTGEITVS